MRRTLPLIAVLIGLLMVPQGALAIGQGGHNAPTNRLEKAFKVALFWRSQDPKGCYLPEKRMAAQIQSRGKIRAGVTRSDNSISRTNIVFVIKKASTCNHLRMGLRARQRLYILDTEVGPVFVKGNKNRGLESLRGGRGPLRAITYATKTFRLNLTPDFPDRLDMTCPGKTSPLGGGISSTPPLDADGEGIYPHSYERLGVQRGWHISVLHFDPSPGTTRRSITLQVVCGMGLVPTSSPHRTVYMRTGQTKTAVARCPGGTKVFSGGFQRNNWISTGGSYVTESRAVGNTWVVSGHAFARWGGELTAIAYCAKDAPALEEVSASTPIAFGAVAKATTPTCPPGHELTAGGFSSNGSTEAFFGDGSINPDGTWSATGYGFFGAVPSFTAYGYCLQPG